ncbi:MAG: hypothetical protein WDN69_08360 [Aliidongia sp.]
MSYGKHGKSMDQAPHRGGPGQLLECRLVHWRVADLEQGGSCREARCSQGRVRSIQAFLSEHQGEEGRVLKREDDIDSLRNDTLPIGPVERWPERVGEPLEADRCQFAQQSSEVREMMPGSAMRHAGFARDRAQT